MWVADESGTESGRTHNQVDSELCSVPGSISSPKNSMLFLQEWCHTSVLSIIASQVTGYFSKICV